MIENVIFGILIFVFGLGAYLSARKMSRGPVCYYGKTLPKRPAVPQARESGTIEIKLSREELAQLTGTTLFIVNRLLSQWDERGAVRALLEEKERVTVELEQAHEIMREALQSLKWRSSTLASSLMEIKPLSTEESAQLTGEALLFASRLLSELDERDVATLDEKEEYKFSSRSELLHDIAPALKGKYWTHVIQVAGQAGIGKTALIREYAESRKWKDDIEARLRALEEKSAAEERLAFEKENPYASEEVH